MKINKTRNLLALSTLLVVACNDANYKPTTVDQNFGMAYRQVTQAQILNPEAAQNPPLDPPKHMDGYAGANTIDAFRDGFSAIEETETLSISVGADGSSN